MALCKILMNLFDESNIPPSIVHLTAVFTTQAAEAHQSPFRPCNPNTTLPLPSLLTVPIFRMPQQLSCCGMCKTVTWHDDYFHLRATCIFTRYEFWVSSKTLCEMSPRSITHLAHSGCWHGAEGTQQVGPDAWRRLKHKYTAGTQQVHRQLK